MANIRVAADAGDRLHHWSRGERALMNAIQEVAAQVDGVRKVDSQVGVGKAGVGERGPSAGRRSVVAGRPRCPRTTPRRSHEGRPGGQAWMILRLRYLMATDPSSVPLLYYMGSTDARRHRRGEEEALMRGTWLRRRE